MQLDQTSESSPLQRRNYNESKFTSSIIQISETYGKVFFLVLIGFSSIIPLLQLYFGVHYSGQCPIDERIPTYMIVAGACGLILAALCAFIVGTFLFVKLKSISITRIFNLAILVTIFLILLLVLFTAIWFLIGCIWIFGAYKHVQFTNSLESNYCQPYLYKTSFGLLIVTFIWGGIQCCLTCFRQCCVGESGS